MGNAYLNSTQIGTFTPQTEGTSGDILVNSTDVGDFTLDDVGCVFVNSTKVGIYCSKGNSHIPRMQAIFGSVEPPEGDILETELQLGCTGKVSSFRVLLQNWDKKYSAGEASAISENDAAQISLGRGSVAPLLLTGKVESVEPHSTPNAHTIEVKGRCTGEQLFRKSVTKEWLSKKGEFIIKALMDDYAKLEHTRNATELIEDTDTTYTKVRRDTAPLLDILKYIAKSADLSGVIGYDFRTEYDGLFAFFAKNTKSSAVSLTDTIEDARYIKDVHRIRHRARVFGAPLKTYPTTKDLYTDQQTTESPGDDGWSGGTLSWNTTDKVVGSQCVQSVHNGVSLLDIWQLLPDVDTIDCEAWKKEAYKFLHFFINIKAAPNPDGETIVYVQLYAPDVDNRFSYFLTGPALRRIPEEGKAYEFKLPLGPDAGWSTVLGSPDWSQISRVRFYIFGINTGNFTIIFDEFYFGGRRFEHIETQAGIAEKDIRELIEVDEELFSDTECELRAKALLAFLKDPREAVSLYSSILDYGTNRLQPADKIPIVLPNEKVDGNFRIDSVRLLANADDQTLQIWITAGREAPRLADYLYGLRPEMVTPEAVSRTKGGS